MRRSVLSKIGFLLSAVGALIILATAVCQLFATYDGLFLLIESKLWAFVGLMVLFEVPIVGSMLAYHGAVEAWGWAPWQAAVAFFWYYGLAVVGLIVMISKALR